MRVPLPNYSYAPPSALVRVVTDHITRGQAQAAQQDRGGGGKVFAVRRAPVQQKYQERVTLLRGMVRQL